MARFDVYRTGEYFVVDVQTDLLDELTTRLVVPLLPLEAAPMPAGRLNPVLQFNGQPYALQPQLMGAVSTRLLGKPLDNPLRDDDRIVAAVDMILNGF